ncbi:hypothetical protein GGH94_002760 [Coemansia aciculifera]|uniref:Uncharacterized protein n=1 Tax=Coemansia aciculifera TaxID=417176 RepID=A0A9W8IIF5_9FUNG|nr:hypothetical protein GGH94_002760 [Coemansia aciculifera]KAJ2873895.1 hypothetical protein GGH93_002857 [Coemansia aciculifera]
MALVRRVKEMAPAVSVIYQDGRDADYKSLEDYDSHAISLISQLYRIVKTTVVSWCNLQLVMNPDLAPIGNLTSIDCALGWLGYHILALARLNAPTLQTFSISSRFDIGICGLIRDSFGNKYVDYPCLRSLTMNNAGVPAILQRSTFEGVVPFPSLRRLAILSHYPYVDDVLFRGNRATLEILNIALYPETVAMLRKYDVFTPTSHPKLRVCTCSFMEDGPSAFNAASNYLKFALSIAPAASMRVFPGLSEFRETVQPALSILEDYTGIQILSLPYLHLSLWKAIVLIKALPVLSDLHTWAPILGAIPQGGSEAGLPEHVRSTHSPMGKRFRCWHFECTQLDDLGEVARCMLLLALACPNLDYAAVDKDYRMPFMDEIRQQLAEPWFNLYAPRLQRLLFTDFIE